MSHIHVMDEWHFGPHRGFAYGFQMREGTAVLYKATDLYRPEMLHSLG